MADMLSQNNIGAVGISICKKLSSCLIQSNSVAVTARALYSASVEDCDTVCCFFYDQEMGLEPKNITNPVVESLSLGLPAQSASENALTVSE